MICNNCGKEVEAGTKFCPGCGKEVSVKKEVVKEVKAEAAPAKKGSGLAIAALILGIVAMVTAFIPVVNIFLPFILACAAIVLGIIGLVKKQGAMALIGLILAAVSIIVAIIMVVVYAYQIGSEAGKQVEDSLKTVKTTIKSGYPYGTWTCVPYTSMNLKGYDYENIATGNSKESLNVLKINTDNTFQYGPYVDSYKNYYKGTFKYTIETEKNEQYKSQGYSFIDVDGKILEFMDDGVKQDVPETGRLHFEMELFETYGYDKALIGFYDSYSISNMYMCER